MSWGWRQKIPKRHEAIFGINWNKVSVAYADVWRAISLLGAKEVSPVAIR